jgi:hypothetical protein
MTTLPSGHPPSACVSTARTCWRRASAYVSIRQHILSDKTCSCLHGVFSLRQMLIRQHTSAYVSVRQRKSADVSERQHTAAYSSMRQHTSAYAGVERASSAPWSAACFTSTKVQILRALLVQHKCYIIPYLSAYFTNSGVCWRMLAYADIC